jgi:hypothetical protein
MKHLSTLFPVIVVLAACGGDKNHGNNQHGGCTFSYSDGWTSSGLVLLHNDERDCPVGIAQGQPASTGAKIVDTKPTSPNLSGYDAKEVDLSIWDHNFGSSLFQVGSGSGRNSSFPAMR